MYKARSPSSARHRAFPLRKKIEILIDVTQGMMYLHGLSLVHRDLKTSNILLDKTLTAKVCDFGQCRYLSSHGTMTAGIGTVVYSAPEILLGKKYDASSDVYSFAIVMHELFFEQKPFENGTTVINPVNIGIMVAQNGLRPPIPDEEHTEDEQKYTKLMQKCWKHEKKSRPTFEKVHELLTKMLTDA